MKYVTYKSYYSSISKNRARWVGLQKSYVINGVGHEKILCLLTRWVGGSKKGLKHAYVTFEWSLETLHLYWSSLKRLYEVRLAYIFMAFFMKVEKFPKIRIAQAKKR